MTTLHQNHRMIVSSACVALLLSPLVQAVLAQDAGASARARAEVMAKEMQARGTITRLSQGLLSVFGEAVNGVNMRISAVDADDPELRELGQRRLIREIVKAKVGDEIELRVLSGSATQTLKLKTVSAEELVPARKLSAASGRLEGLEKRASIGAAIGSTGSVRDTLGIFIYGVVSSGPAEQAGIAGKYVDDHQEPVGSRYQSPCVSRGSPVGQPDAHSQGYGGITACTWANAARGLRVSLDERTPGATC